MSTTQTISKKNECIPKDCTKFNPYFKGIDIKNAIAYLKLRTDGCPKQSALQFCSKTVCKCDSTKVRDGPSNFRTLKIRKEQNPVTLNGWLNTMPMFDMGKNYQCSIKEIIKDGDKNENELLQNIREDDKLKHKFNSKIKNQNNYYTELKEKTTIQNLRQKQDNVGKLKRNLQQIKQEIVNMVKEQTGNKKKELDEEDLDELAKKKLKTENKKIEVMKSANRRELMQKVSQIREDLDKYASKVYKNKEEQKNMIVLAKNEESRKKIFENVMFKDLDELIQYADYLKRMIDEVEIDANGIIKKQSKTPQTNEERIRQKSNSSRGLTQLKKSVEVAKEFNQANYLFFRKDEKQSFKTEFENQQKFDGVVDNMNTYRISNNLQLDLKNTRLLINQPQNFKKYLQSYSDLNHYKEKEACSGIPTLNTDDLSISKDKPQTFCTDAYRTQRGKFYDRERQYSVGFNTTRSSVKPGSKKYKQHPKFITLGGSHFLKSKNYGNMLSEHNRVNSENKNRNPVRILRKSGSVVEKAYESHIGFGDRDEYAFGQNDIGKCC